MRSRVKVAALTMRLLNGGLLLDAPLLECKNGKEDYWLY
jgi:hypothetical protein